MDHLIKKAESLILYTLGGLVVLMGFVAHWSLYVLPTMQ